MDDGYISIDLIDENPQVRSEVEDNPHSLAETIQNVGLLQPILVRRSGDRYVVVDGHRRLHALKELGVQSLRVGSSIVLDTSREEKETPGKKRKKADAGPVRMEGAGTRWKLNARDIDDQADSKFKQLIANIQRKDLNPIELGRAFVALKDEGIFYVEQARMLGTTETYVYDKAGLLNLTQEMQAIVSVDWQAAKKRRESGEDPGYLVGSFILRDIARLPGELQREAYDTVKSGQMNRQRSLDYLGELKNKHEQAEKAEEEAKEETETVERIGRLVEKARKPRASHITPLTRCLRKATKIIDLLDETANNSDPETTIEAIDGLIRRLQEIRTRVGAQ